MTALIEEKLLPKILSPINSYEGAVAVVGAGTDEIYCGAVMPEFKHFFGSNYLGVFRGPMCEIPTYEELGKVVKYAHHHNVKVFLTLNSAFIVESMEKDLKVHIRKCVDQGVDALIVENLGLISMIRRMGVELPFIASMYNVILNYGTVEFLRKKGYSRAVLECHLTLPEIAEIIEHSTLPIEVFVHGGGCSNLQRCCMLLHFKSKEMVQATASEKSWTKQPCNIPFDIYDFENGQLKAKDTPILDSQTMCAVCLIPSLVKMGVYGFKITGRCEGIAYQKNITQLYRRLLDQISRGELKSYKETIDLLRKNFYPSVSSSKNLWESCCESKRCQYPQLTHTPYKSPMSWHTWTKYQFKRARFEI